MSRSGKYYHLRPPLPEAIWERVAEADRLNIYSLSREQASGSEGCERLHGYPILSQVDVVGPRTAEVYSSLRAGSEEGTLGQRCFMPRHGVRAIRGEKALDLVICFACTNMAMFESSECENFVWADMSTRPQSLLDEYLGLGITFPGLAQLLDEEPEEPDEYVSWADLHDR
jgi:hypothetical protein